MRGCSSGKTGPPVPGLTRVGGGAINPPPKSDKHLSKPNNITGGQVTATESYIALTSPGSPSAQTQRASGEG